MRPGISNISHTSAGDVLGRWETTDRSLHAGRAVRMRRLTLYVVDAHGPYEQPVTAGYLTEDDALAAAEEYMREPDGRGITQQWRRVDSVPGQQAD